ncbi:iron ABC transporter ATP-binding protein [Nautilia sp. PV-1]|uniref:ABC transporter ATP-binding protein n=1 Tax=Nautilia sp. PV-1 TaxID=2579250 RepID=UPI000FDBD6BD|nr:ABC transporter ATP-binding protein [Nautilia sp. PV-1]AZV46418.1 iron ABC transporter ATP-binding protein [Nautilia sp. PV-1]
MIFSVDNLRFCYKSSKILNDISFELKKGEVVAILGVNGAGKSTLLKSIARIIKPKKGTVYLGKEDLHRLDYAELGKKVGYVNQKSEGGYLNVFDTLLLGRKVYFRHSPKKEDLAKVEEMLKILDLEKKAFVPTNELSGGELQKVVIARALLQESEVLLLDEPTNNLDIKNQVNILKLIRNYSKNKEILSILVMHDINLALKFCDKFIFMKNGKIEEEGDISIINGDIIKKIYDIDVEICEYKNDKIIIIK